LVSRTELKAWFDLHGRGVLFERHEFLYAVWLPGLGAFAGLVEARGELFRPDYMLMFALYTFPVWLYGTLDTYSVPASLQKLWAYLSYPPTSVASNLYRLQLLTIDLSCSSTVALFAAAGLITVISLCLQVFVLSATGRILVSHCLVPIVISNEVKV
jgi:hypothetical protein